METWLLPALVALGLSASTGLKTFIPLLTLAVSARFGLLGVELSGPFAWLSSTSALIALSLATVVELAADKIPIVDHAVSLVGTVAKPVAGAIAAAAAFHHVDPGMAALAGLIIGAPTALAVHAAQATTRVASTATTAGLANPALSLAEDVGAFGGAVLALVAPVVALLALSLCGIVAWRLLRSRRVRGGVGAR